MKILMMVVSLSASFASSAFANCTCSGDSCTNGNITYHFSDGECSSNAGKPGIYSCAKGKSNQSVDCSSSTNANNTNGGAASETDITKENRGGYGGAYKTTNVSTTDAINQTSQYVAQTVNQVGASSVNNAGASANANLASSGTAAAAAQGTADTLNADAKAQTVAATMKMASSMTQLYRAREHQKSALSVEQTAAAASNVAAVKHAQCLATVGLEGDATACDRAYDAQKINIATNGNAEQAVQRQAADKEAILAAGNGLSAVTNLQQAAADRAAASAALSAANSGFAFNPGTGSGYTDGGSTTDPTASTGAVLDSAAPTDSLAGANQINPTLDSAAPNGTDGRLGAGAPAAAAPAGGGGGVQTAGGTTAGKDDSANKDTTQPGKQSAGSYGEANGPSGFSRIAGSAPVGMDNSFADMLKKFLPDSEDKKKDGADLNFGDRMPASDAAAVIARNKNIFEEVSKRYKKKSTEGAIVF